MYHFREALSFKQSTTAAQKGWEQLPKLISKYIQIQEISDQGKKL